MALARSLTERVEANEESLEGLFAGLGESERKVKASLGEAANTAHETLVFPASSSEPSRDAVVRPAEQAPPSAVRREDSRSLAAAGGQQLRLL